MKRALSAVGLLAVCLTWVTVAHALTPAQRCEVAKNKAVGKYGQCIAAQRAREIAGHTPAYAGCATNLTNAFSTAETSAGGACPTTGDAAVILARIKTVFDPSTSAGVEKALAGSRFIDDGDGTITDTRTALQWEKKDTAVGSGANPADPHDADNVYSWSNSGTVPDGAAFTDFLGRLNNCTSNDVEPLLLGFAGHCDWRLPTKEELKTILDVTQGSCGGGSGPCIDPIFGPTALNAYWSETTCDGTPTDPFYVAFNNGFVRCNFFKTAAAYVRAVRAAS